MGVSIQLEHYYVLTQMPHFMKELQRKSTTEQAVPSRISEPGKIFVKKHVRKSKYNSLVEEAELLHANHQ